jgi:DnaJ-class molecular chaperone
MAKNYYIILGIPKNSSQEDIRAAYRRLAKEFHPDHYGKNQAPFQIIQEAYSVLSNPKSRKSYDHSLQPKSTVSTPTRDYSAKVGTNEAIEPLIPDGDTRFRNMNAFNRSFHQQSTVFDDIFGAFMAENIRSHDPEMMLPQDISIEITLSPIQAQLGGSTRVDLPIQYNCPSCHRYPRHSFACRRCNGTGILRGEKPVYISYPPGIRNNQVIRFTIKNINAGKIFLNAIFKIY